MPTFPMLAIARTAGNPVIGENIVTFLWQGKEPVTLIEDLHNWEEYPQPMVKAASGLWLATLQLPPDGYLEYAFSDPKTGKRVPDPLNPRKVWNGIDAYNHYFYMPKAAPSPLVELAKGIPRGTVTRHEVQTREYAVGAKRTVYLYQPPVKDPVPLVIVYDGSDYLRRGKLNVIVDNLIAENHIHPFGMAMVQNGGRARSLEYACAEATLSFLFECVIPLAQEHLVLTPPGGEPYGVMGASLGALMAMYTGLRLPRIFGKVLCQAGSYGVPEYEYVVMDLVRYGPHLDLQVWMDAGRFDSLLETNRDMYALLKEKGYRVNYNEFSGGHNYTSWRNDLWRGLEVLFKK